MSRVDIFYTTCRLVTQNLEPTLPGFRGLMILIQYLDTHPHKPIFYPSNSYDRSNVTILTWIEDQVEDYTYLNFL